MPQHKNLSLMVVELLLFIKKSEFPRRHFRTQAPRITMEEICKPRYASTVVVLAGKVPNMHATSHRPELHRRSKLISKFSPCSSVLTTHFCATNKYKVTRSLFTLYYTILSFDLRFSSDFGVFFSPFAILSICSCTSSDIISSVVTSCFISVDSALMAGRGISSMRGKTINEIISDLIAYTLHCQKTS